MTKTFPPTAMSQRPGRELEVLPLNEAVVLLAEAEEERAETDWLLDEVLQKLGFVEGWLSR